MKPVGFSYEWETRVVGQNVEFAFESVGRKVVPKIVSYTLIGHKNNKPVFNLGFGNYDYNTNTVSDNSTDNNGDAYRVFNTVLLTVPAFFNIHPDTLIMVRGSDSGEEFVSSCKENCHKNCLDDCRNEHRRISLYKRYIEENYPVLTCSYKFFGSLLYDDPKFVIENFKPGEPYRSLFMIKS